MRKGAGGPKTLKKSKTKGKGPRRNLAGLWSGQYRKRSTVYVERLRGPDEARRLDEDDLYTTDAYIVITTRTDGQFTHSVELRGDQTRLPGKVVERIIAHRAAIVTEERSDRARERQERIKAEGIAQADQEEAEEERERDLGGL